MGLGKWLLIGAVVVGAWMFLVPYSIKCRVPIIGDGCKASGGLGALGVDVNAPPVTQLDDLLAGVTNPEMASNAIREYKANFARTQMLRGIY